MSSNVYQLIQTVEARGGHFFVKNERLIVQPETAALPLFEDLHKHEQEIIAVLLERDAATWKKPFQIWLYSNCILSPNDAVGFNILFKTFQAWTAAQNRPHSYPNLFEYLLAEDGFEIRNVSGTDLVFGLLLPDDADMFKLCR